MISYIDGWWNQCMSHRLIVWSLYLWFTQSFACFGCSFRCLLPIVFFCFLLFCIQLLWYYRLHFTFTQIATWPRHFAWFSINQWKLTISCCKWRIRTYKSSMMPCMIPPFIHIAYHHQAHELFPFLLWA